MLAQPDQNVIDNYFNSNLIKQTSPTNDYDWQKGSVSIGKGSYAEVYLVTHKLSKLQFAVKKYTSSRSKSTILEDMKNEFDIMRALRHPHVVRAYEAFNFNHECYVVSEYCSGGELFDRIISKIEFTETEVRILVGQLMDAIYYIHSLGIVHRDIKPENILYFDRSKNFKVKITDFGVSKQSSHTEENPATPQFKSFIASKYYVAPEILDEKPHYSFVVDCWAVGVIIYIIMVGYAPFDGKTSVEVYKKIKKKQIRFYSTEWNRYSRDSLIFTKRLLTKDPIMRMTSEQAVQHRWIRSPGLHKFHYQDAVKNTEMRMTSSFHSDSGRDNSGHHDLEKTKLLSSLSLIDMKEINNP